MNRDQARRAVAAIRARFPNPRSIHDRDSGDWYCVVTAADDHLESSGCTLSRRFRDGFDITQIIDANDAGKFELAWALLEYALTTSEEPALPFPELMRQLRAGELEPIEESV